MLKYFISFESIFCQTKIQAEKDAEIQAKMDNKIQAENDSEIQAKKKANIHNLYLSKHYAMYHKTWPEGPFGYMLVTYFQLVQNFFGEDLYLNTLNEEW